MKTPRYVEAIGQVLSRLPQHKSLLSRPASKRRRHRVSDRLGGLVCLVEPLETRQMLTGISAQMVEGVLAIDGTGTHDTISLDQGSSVILVQASNSIGTQNWSFPVAGISHIQVNGHSGNDTIDLGRVSLNSIVKGGNGDDVIYGGSGRDNLSGMDGNDTLWGGKGVDKLFGDLDNDELHGGDDGDYIVGGGGYDVLYGDAGDDRMGGGDKTDVLHGGSGNDKLYGDDGHDRLYGEDGDDYLSGSDGNDKLFGGNGNDLLRGGAGEDLLRGTYGNDILWGGEGNDTLYGDHDNDELHGEAGDDALVGGGGYDVLYGDEGDDRMGGGDKTDKLYGGPGNDKLYGDDGSDHLYGEDGDDYLSGGSSGDDHLVGGNGNDLLRGGNGDDWIGGGTGDDIVYGGAGDDTIYGDFGNDTLYGEDGEDYLSGSDGNDKLFGGNHDDVLRGGADADFLSGMDGNDVLWGSGGNDELYGDLGDDELHGEDGHDYIVGGGGYDVLYGGIGKDIMEGGPKNDKLYGGPGNDELHGNDGYDQLFGEGGNDYLYGGSSGKKYLDGGDDNDVLHGGPEADIIGGGSGDDIVYGGQGDDKIYGDTGNDTLYGEDGEDYLSGSSGNDRLYGGNHDDTLRGNAGEDYLFGQAGEDTVHLQLDLAALLSGDFAYRNSQRDFIGDQVALSVKLGDALQRLAEKLHNYIKPRLNPLTAFLDEKIIDIDEFGLHLRWRDVFEKIPAAKEIVRLHNELTTINRFFGSLQEQSNYVGVGTYRITADQFEGLANNPFSQLAQGSSLLSLRELGVDFPIISNKHALLKIAFGEVQDLVEIDLTLSEFVGKENLTFETPVAGGTYFVGAVPIQWWVDFKSTIDLGISAGLDTRGVNKFLSAARTDIQKGIYLREFTLDLAGWLEVGTGWKSNAEIQEALSIKNIVEIKDLELGVVGRIGLQQTWSLANEGGKLYVFEANGVKARLEVQNTLTGELAFQANISITASGWTAEIIDGANEVLEDAAQVYHTVETFGKKVWGTITGTSYRKERRPEWEIQKEVSFNESFILVNIHHDFQTTIML